MNHQNANNKHTRFGSTGVYEYDSTAICDDVLLQNNNAVRSEDGSALVDFYKNSTILITGGTGFVGKALIEKLLRTCTNISRIYILIRPNRNQTVEERLKHLLSSSVFNRIRSEDNSEKLLSKLIGLAGDMTEPNLGISSEYLQILIDNVTVVFHSAAIVKFNERFDTAAKINILGTQKLLLICQKMTKLKALVYISTAYSNPDPEKIEERVYPIPNFQREMRNSDKILSIEQLEQISKNVEQTHPNSYTLTKAMTEVMLAEFNTNFPIAIVRPSMVTAAWREPFEGWIEDSSSFTLFMIALGQGLVSSFICDHRFIAEPIPVDIVVNTVVASAYYICTSSPNKLEVFNCTSGSFNPISWGELCHLIHRYSLTMPSENIRWYPTYSLRTNRVKHFLHEGMCQFLPALFGDIMLKLTGHEPGMLEGHAKLTKLKSTAEFGTKRPWNFATENIRILQEIIRQSSEKEIFNIDLTKINWDVYMKNYVWGNRKYILKESEDTLPSAQTKLKRLYWMRQLIRIFSLAVIYRYTLNCKI